LQSEAQFANNFSVVALIEEESYGPQPFEIRANVIGSNAPIAQVEYYIGCGADPDSDPYELIAAQYGPEYVIYRDYGSDKNGCFIKVRAIDIYGNVAESDPQSFTRLDDGTNPSATISVVDSPVVSGNDIIAGQSFVVELSVQDDESGIQQSVLRRNDVIIAARFEDGVLQVNETAGAVGAYVYEATVLDNAGNQRVVTKTY
jgi:hypothetical protein